MYCQEQDIEQERGLNLSPAMLIDTLFAIGAITHRIGIQLNEVGSMSKGASARQCPLKNLSHGLGLAEKPVTI
jgi:hypothetical protein